MSSPAPIAPGNPADPVYLLSFSSPVKECALSGTPFGGKMEMVMRMAGIEYEGLIGDVTKQDQAPKGKLPTLKHGDNLIADSSDIYTYLRSTFPDKMTSFTPTDDDLAAQALVLQRVLEEDIYFIFLYFEWLCDEGFNAIAPVFFKAVPYLLRGFVARTVRKKMIRDLQGQGTGKHTKQEVTERAAKDIAAVNTVLGDQPFLTGKKPSQADCFLFALMEWVFASATLQPEGQHVVASIFRQQSNLMRFYKTLRTKYCEDASAAAKHWQRTLAQVPKSEQ